MNLLFLDTETTGIPAYGHEPLGICVPEAAGTVLLEPLIRPVQHTKWPEAELIHGISPEMVFQPEGYYMKTELPAGLIWSGSGAVPAIGSFNLCTKLLTKAIGARVHIYGLS